MTLRQTLSSVFVVLACGAAGFSCAGADHAAAPTVEPKDQGQGSPGGLVRSASAGSDTELVFPPATDGRRRRETLPSEYVPAGTRPPQVVLPSLDGEQTFRIPGKQVKIHFDQPMKGARPGAPAVGLLSIEPAVSGVLQWEDERTLSFAASRFLDPEQPYRVTLGALSSATGTALPGSWQGTFRATVGAVIAGKGVGHVPVVGKHRVVALRPSDVTIGPRSQLRVLFDQPIQLALARQLVSLSDRNGAELPVALTHPPLDSFAGVRVDRRFVVLAVPRRPLLPGQKVRLVADDGLNVTGRQRHRSDLDVAEPIRFTGTACGWWSRPDEVCDSDAGRLRTNRRQIHIRFNNAIRVKPRQLRAHVQVTPRVRNLTIANEGYSEGRLVVTGDFRPSTRYRLVVAGLTDEYGQRQRQPVQLSVEVIALGASVAMPEGLIVLDDERTRAFGITSRNVAEVEMRLWPVAAGDEQAFRAALRQTRAGSLDTTGAPQRLVIPVAAVRDELVTTKVDLSTQLAGGSSYLATVAPSRFAFAAEPLRYPRDSAAARPPVALLRLGHPQSLAVHAHSAPGTTIVQVARLSSGAPVAGAEVGLSDSQAGSPVTTDAQGVAVIQADTSRTRDAFLTVKAGAEQIFVPLAQAGASAEGLFPDLARGEATSWQRRALLITDRGIYRPGATIGIKASLYQPDGGSLSPVAGQALVVKVTGPTGGAVCDERATTSDLGGVALQCALPADSKLGIHRIEAWGADDSGTPVARSVVRVADFEPPRFKVDVDAATSSAASTSLAATIRGRYLFGAPMSGASLRWSLRRSPAPFPSGPLTDRGLSFRAQPSWYEDEPETSWARTGEATLDEAGALQLTQALSFAGAAGPQRFVLEADVTDSSYRHVASRAQVTGHPASRYAGVKLSGGWVDVGAAVPVELGVIDRAGKPVVGTTVVAKLERVSWRYARQRGPGGAVSSEWRRSETEVARCAAKSASQPVTCTLLVPRSGDYRVTAEVDGRRGGSAWLWAWRDGDTGRQQPPTKGNVVQVVTDKARYKPGDTARLLVLNPYPAAIAIVTTEAGRLLGHQSLRVNGSAGVIEVPIEAHHAPHVHTTVTLVPVGAQGEARASYRIGAARLPVSLSGTRLDVAVTSDKASYRPGEEAEITVQVRDGQNPESNAEIALAVVDEGVLRLTNFRAADPAKALRPPMPLGFLVRDSRTSLAALLERSHVAGDGGGAAEGSMAHTRRRFVQTALWKPMLRTDDRGEARVRFTLPDNLTELRMMAVVVDGQGKGGAKEASFTVDKPILMQAVLPRFAHVGDRFEVAAMVHNNTDARFAGTVRLPGASQPVSIPARGRLRVGTTLQPSAPGELPLVMEVEDGDGRTLDRVERQLPVSLPGIDVRPSLSGDFSEQQLVALRIPEGVLAPEGRQLVIEAGEHLWPELGARLDYLLDYPHGCIEQTTSSTLPLIAARTILPRIGARQYTEQFFRERIEAGLRRLAKMRTPSGGLAYWPGRTEPHPYGTAYAIRAVMGAQQAGIEPPPGLLSGMVDYLGDRLRDSSTDEWLRISIAESLAKVGELPPGLADALFDMRGEVDLFSRAGLALTLDRLPDQGDRVKGLVDDLEAAFGDDGTAKTSLSERRYGCFESDRRTLAQVVIALSRLRPRSPLLPKLVAALAERPGGYTTQSTAYALLALADHLGRTPATGADVSLELDGRVIAPHRELGSGGREYRIALADLVGKEGTLRLRAAGQAAVGYRLSTAYHLPLATEAAAEEPAMGPEPPAMLLAQSGRRGPDIYRVFTDAAGAPVDLTRVAAGDVLRVAILVRMPRGEGNPQHYLALTDRLAAGFEPIQPELATVAAVPEIGDRHPFAAAMRYSYDQASHVELHHDRVQIYFDRVRAAQVVASYLVRATTPGSFTLLPTAGELMYRPDSRSYSDGAEVTIL